MWTKCGRDLLNILVILKGGQGGHPPRLGAPPDLNSCGTKWRCQLLWARALGQIPVRTPVPLPRVGQRPGRGHGNTSELRVQIEFIELVIDLRDIDKGVPRCLAGRPVSPPRTAAHAQAPLR